MFYMFKSEVPLRLVCMSPINLSLYDIIHFFFTKLAIFKHGKYVITKLVPKENIEIKRLNSETNY